MLKYGVIMTSTGYIETIELDSKHKYERVWTFDEEGSIQTKSEEFAKQIQDDKSITVKDKLISAIYRDIDSPLFTHDLFSAYAGLN